MRVNVNVLNDTIQGRDGKAPYIGENGHWYVWDNDSETWVDSGVWAGNGPTIVEVIWNSDRSLTFFFGDGTRYTTPPLNGIDGNKIVYWTDSDKTLRPEGYDGEGIWHISDTGYSVMTSSTFPYGFPSKGDFIITKGGCLLKCTSTSTIGIRESFEWVCVANLNGESTVGDEITVKRLNVTEHASIVGLAFREVDVNGVTHLRLE